jgi:hypothetical protein
MPTHVRGPRMYKGALVIISDSNTPLTSIPFQYNPASLSRSLRSQTDFSEGGEPIDTLHFKGAPTETFTVTVEIDAADQLEAGDTQARLMGIAPELAALEILLYPPTRAVTQRKKQLDAGTIEVVPLVVPVLLFVWGPNRVMPVTLTGVTVNEKAFDLTLNPIQAEVSLEMRVLSYSDVSAANPAYGRFLSYQQNKESIAQVQTNLAMGALRKLTSLF